MNIPFGERMYVVSARILIREDGPGDAVVAVNDILAMQHEFIDVKVDAVSGPEPLDHGATLASLKETDP